MLVGMDLLSCGAHHDRGVQPGDPGFGGLAPGPESLAAFDRREAAFAGSFALSRFVAAMCQLGPGRHHQVGLVLVLARMLVQVEAVTAGQAAHRPRPVYAREPRLKLLHAQLGITVDVGGLGEAARVVVHLQLGGCILARRLDRGLGQGLGRREVEIPQHHLAGLDFLAGAPFGDGLQVDLPVRRIAKHELLLLRMGFVCARRIDNHHGVFVGRVFEVVVDAFLLHQTAYEVEVGLAVLHAVLVFRQRAGKLKLVVRAERLEHLLQDVLQRQVLEHPCVGAPGQQPQPWPQDHAVAEQLFPGAFGAHGADQAMEMARGAFRQQDGHAGWFSQQVFRLDGAAVSNRLEVELEQLAQFLARVHAAEQQVLAQRGLQRHRIVNSHGPVPSLNFAVSHRPGRGPASRQPAARSRSAAPPR